jgi:hypothetical protein
MTVGTGPAAVGKPLALDTPSVAATGQVISHGR